MSNLNSRQFGNTVKQGEQSTPAKMPGQPGYHIMMPSGSGFSRLAGYSKEHPFSKANQTLLSGEERKLARKGRKTSGGPLQSGERVVPYKGK